MNENTKKTKPFRGSIIAGIAFLLIAGVTVAMHVAWAGNTRIPAVELDSHFDLADKDKDGVVTREEFQGYLEARKLAAEDRSLEVKICPNSGMPCTGDGTGMCGSGMGMCSGGGCSDGGSGCCGNKAVSGNESGCCKEKSDESGKSCCKSGPEA